MPSKTIACLSNPSSSRSSVGFHCLLYFLYLWRVYLTIPLETRGTQIIKKLFYFSESAFGTLVKSSKHKSGNPLNANATKTEFQRLRKEKRRYSRSQR